MSHQPERKEKDCLNCGTLIQGRYCHRCGQENIVTHQSFWALTKHFVFDILHFDGKFFDTLKYLFFLPGGVPKEYIKGRRTRYLDPIRMYLFTSAVFFLIFFSISKIDPGFRGGEVWTLSKTDRFEMAAQVIGQQSSADSLKDKKLALLLDTSISLQVRKVKGSKAMDSAQMVEIDSVLYTMHPENDMVPNDTIDANITWVEKKLNEKWKKSKRQYGDDINQMLGIFIDRFIHWFPYILFVSLPLFAWILKLLYIRRKPYVYSDHAVFTLYHYIFSFILLLIIIGVNRLQDFTGWGFFNTLGNILIISWFVYLFFSLRRFYGQSFKKTLGKFLLLNVLGLLSFILINALFLLFFIIQL